MNFQHLTDPDPPEPTEKNRQAVISRAVKLRRRRRLEGGAVVGCCLAVVLGVSLSLQSSVSPSRLFRLGPPYRISVTLSAKLFPLSVYPDALEYPPPVLVGAASDWSGCPSLVGVVASTRPTPNLVARLLDQLGRSKLSAFEASDRSYWPIIVGNGCARFKDLAPGRILIMPAAQSGYVGLLSHCTTATVRHTWVAETCPGPDSVPAPETCDRDPALAGHVFLIDRQGHWLVVFTYP